jgi:hypothetical protein
MYEARAVESLNPVDPSGGAGQKPNPRQIFRIGFSVSGSDLLQPQDEGCGIFFDAEGHCLTTERKGPLGGMRHVLQARTDVLGVVLNLGLEGQFAQTASLFRNGERVGQPQKLPDSLKGKVLFPHIIYRGYTLSCNFGPHHQKAMPFKCRFLQNARQVDVSIAEPAKLNDGKFEVIFPISLPDQGTFRWLDKFLKDNPHYTELSERRLLEWAKKKRIDAKGWRSCRKRFE